MNAFAKAHKIPHAQAKQQLEQLLSYTLHKPRRRRFPTLPTKVFSINEQFVLDLVDLQTLAKYNKGHKYLLTMIDVFSKYAWVKNKKFICKNFLKNEQVNQLSLVNFLKRVAPCRKPQLFL